MRSYVILERPDGATLAFDAWIEGSFSGSAIITDHPIEDGSTVSDHAQAEPLQITLTVKQSETPLSTGDSGPFGEERIREAMRFLDAAGRAGEVLDVSIPRVDFYENLVLASWPNTITAARSSDFEIVLRQIEIAEAFVVSVPVEAIAPPARAGQQEEADRGTQATEETEEDAGGLFGRFIPDADESLLSRIF